MYWNKKDIETAERRLKLNIINSITGIKPANLIGTVSDKRKDNLAIFSSVIHLGSSPALIGFILRPKGEVPRNTHDNIMHNQVYTINHVPQSLIKNAHYTSAKFDENISEFERCNFTAEYIDGFDAPFVKESVIKIGLRFREEIPIPLNNTSLMIGEIEHIFVPDEYISPLGYIDLEKAETAAISGLNTYYKLNKLDSFPYVRLEEVPDFD